MREETGVTFTEFDRLPGWYGVSNCPLDAMHIIHLGTSKHMVKNILIKPGLMNPRNRRQPLQDQPFHRANGFLARTIFPSFCTRKLPDVRICILLCPCSHTFCQFEHITSGTKADQMKHLTTILYAVLFDAWKDGDSIPDGNTPRGSQKSRIYKFQQSQAKQVHRMKCHVHNYEEGDDDNWPTLESCASVRSRRLIFGNILRYCYALKILFRHHPTRQSAARGQRLLARVGALFAKMNIPLTPNYHYLMHLEETILKFGSLYGTWTFPYERANRYLININNNGHTLGALETTMARGFLKRAGSLAIVRQLVFFCSY
jgi:hypothetical protein